MGWVVGMDAAGHKRDIPKKFLWWQTLIERDYAHGNRVILALPRSLVLSIYQ